MNSSIESSHKSFITGSLKNAKNDQLNLLNDPNSSTEGHDPTPEIFIEEQFDNRKHSTIDLNE